MAFGPREMRVAPRFVRGMFRNTESKEPAGTDAGDTQAHKN